MQEHPSLSVFSVAGPGRQVPTGRSMTTDELRRVSDNPSYTRLGVWLCGAGVEGGRDPVAALPFSLCIGFLAWCLLPVIVM